MKQYTKKIDNKWIKKYANDIVIERDGMVTYRPSEELILSDGWILDTTSSILEDTMLNRAKNQKIWEINKYDTSDHVNQFYINNIPVWLNKETRVGLKLRFEAEQFSGKTETTLWYNGKSFTLNLADALNMLMILENYASTCYDVTQFHVSSVTKLENIEEVKSYNFKTGYPDNLYF